MPPGAFPPDPAAAFYARLATEYETLIRHLVPRYDELLEVVLGLLDRVGEGRGWIVDVGTGPGEVAAALLDRLPRARLLALDASPAMAERAGQALARFGSRARVLRADVRSFAPDVECDGAYSTLVLHNLAPAERAAVLSRMVGWLPSGAPFVWADFVLLRDPRLRAAVAERRRAFALAAGCDPEVVEWNFRKEADDDRPTTVEEMLAAGRAAGFDPVDVVWAEGAFAVLLLRSPAR